MLQNDETMVLEADFCRDGIVDNDESIDAKRTTDNNDLTTENDARSNKDDTKGIKEEFKEENELTIKMITILSKSTDKKPEIETEKGLTEKQKKINEKLIERVMVIEQQQDMSDLRGIAEEIKEETEFTTKTATSSSKSTEMTMEITTTKSSNEKEKKINEKTMEIAMVIAQQQNLIFGEEILSNYGQESTEMVATVDANVEHVFYLMNESKMRVKVQWKFESLLVSEVLTESMKTGYYWKLQFLF